MEMRLITNEGCTTRSTLIEYEGYKFVLAGSPHAASINLYIKELKYYNVTHFVRASELTYDPKMITGKGFEVITLEPIDGSPCMTEENINQWFEIVKNHCHDKNTCIAVHCKSGLGRSAYLVALTLIELGMTNEEAIELIRYKKRGAFNRKQYEALTTYQRKFLLKAKEQEKEEMKKKSKKASLKKIFFCI